MRSRLGQPCRFPSTPRDILGRRAVSIAVVVLVAVVGSVDLVRAVRATAENQRLSEQWHAARTGAPVTYLAGVDPLESANTFYLPCDPPYHWGSELWYLREVLHRGSGLSDAAEGGAFPLEGGPRLVRGTGREASPRIVTPSSADGDDRAARLREAELIDTAERLERARLAQTRRARLSRVEGAGGATAHRPGPHDGGSHRPAPAGRVVACGCASLCGQR